MIVNLPARSISTPRVAQHLPRHQWLLAAIIIAFGALVLVPPLRAQAPGGALPAPVGYVNDFARVIPGDVAARLDDLARRVQAATGGDMVVVTLPSLEGRPVEEVALRLGREWKVGANSAIGEASRNAGVVILVVPKETADDGQGRCRIEVGQGAEGFITDAAAGSLCRTVIPRFQARDYGGAIEALSVAIAQRYAEAFGVTLEGVPQRSRSRGSPDGGVSPLVLLLLVFVVLTVLSSRSRGRRSGCVGCLPLIIPGPGMGGGYRGGGFGGGFGGGGGGGFGGFGGGGGFSGGGGGSSW